MLTILGRRGRQEVTRRADGTPRTRDARRRRHQPLPDRARV